MTSLTLTRSIPTPNRRIWWQTAGLLLLGLIPILTGSMQLFTINHGLTTGEILDPTAANYIAHPWPIVTHILAGSAFNLLGPWQFVAPIRQRWPLLHRTAGRVFFLAAILVALSALWMNLFFPAFGGGVKFYSNLLFGLGLLFALGLSLRAVLRRDIRNHRAWIMRAYGIGLGVATQRLILLPVYMIAGDISDAVLGAGLLAGWLLNLAVVEWVLHRPRQRA